ncbi:hypothetical protein BCR34DRAFT_596300 [Clohesyomyces aquaticus]|uniref:Zinc finger PHD-type domain-containing protein n=1 Tax=Clohesyomyces aquaticus TaxID=1231657 RepID=A0A1Y2A744_9PLEO|nr:hypothetical protein BCR34DRAFT_596300 [Clohesyomyces aquaticus]
MRGRSHQCDACKGFNSNHFKRHTLITEVIRAIYKTCNSKRRLVPCCDTGGQSYNTTDRPCDLCSAVNRDADKAWERELGDPDARHSSVSTDGGTQGNPEATKPKTTKKQRKEAKKLAKAASRPKEMTKSEIAYVGSIIHTGGVEPEDIVHGPSSVAEVELYEINLRYNAQVYNDGMPRSELRRHGTIHQADVDFEAEVDRVMKILGIDELEQSNANSRGLRGKELKCFLVQVGRFKKLVVDDLVLFKKEQHEIRMRRMGFVRWSKKGSVETLKERHEEKNWATGQRKTRVETPQPRDDNDLEANGMHDDKENTPPAARSTNSKDRPGPQTPPTNQLGSPKADTRHLRNGGTLATPTPAPRSGQARVLRITDTRAADQTQPGPSEAAEPRTASLKLKDAPLPEISAWQLPKGPIAQPSKDTSVLSPLQPSHGGVQASSSQSQTWSLVDTCRGASKENIPETVTEGKKPGLKEPDAVAQDQTPGLSKPRAERFSPPVSSKKTKKRLRNQKAKERKAAKSAAAKNRTDTPPLDGDDKDMANDFENPDAYPVTPPHSPTGKGKARMLEEEELVEALSSKGKGKAASTEDPDITRADVGDDDSTAVNFISSTTDAESQSKVRSFSISESTYHDEVSFPIPECARQEEISIPICECTHHEDWMLFIEELTLGSSAPIQQQEKKCCPACEASNPCPFEDRQMLDCPWHHHATKWSPIHDQAYVVVPATHPLILGSFNHKRAECVYSLFTTETRTRDRIMVVDEDLKEWLMVEQFDPNKSRNAFKYMPIKLQKAIAYHTSHSVPPLPAMRQETQYNELRLHNNAASCLLSQHEWENMLPKLEGRVKDADRMCYCELGTASCGHDVIECGSKDCRIGVFHRICVDEFDPEKFSRWYCSECIAEMTKLSEVAIKTAELLCGKEGYLKRIPNLWNLKPAETTEPARQVVDKKEQKAAKEAKSNAPTKNGKATR